MLARSADLRTDRSAASDARAAARAADSGAHREARVRSAAAEAGSARGWAAHLELGFAHRADRTVLVHRRHEGPLLVQRPFYPEGPGVCHGVLLHPPGGVVGGDRLRLDVTVGAGAHALLTTPAATKLYRSAGPTSELDNALVVGNGGTLEWLPQETIAFAGARARQTTRVELAPDARFLGWEVLCLGRPAAGETFERGEVCQALEIWRAGRPLLIERGRYGGGSELLRARWGLGGAPVLATLLAVAPRGGLAAAWPGVAAEPPGELAALTEINGVLVARCLAPSADAARRWLLAGWRGLRPVLAGLAVCPPRIWNT